MLSLIDKDVPQLRFAVPTGNFGDILAGFYAMKLGVPINVTSTLALSLSRSPPLPSLPRLRPIGLISST